MTTRKLHVDTDERVESGSVQFVYKNGREDWNGLFIRGDHSFALALALRQLEPHLEQLAKDQPHLFFPVHEVMGLRKTISGEVIVGGGP